MRKLAAIMFTDLVGYTALSQKNEALALELLEEHRQLLRPLFIKHNGQEIKTIGDAFLVEFASAVEAAGCAIAIQKILVEHNASVPAERHIMLRIGLHVGDIVIDGDDVLGDGVNIASRIEPLAQPGGVCLTEAVAEQVRNKIDQPLELLGEKELKGIKKPVTVYRIVMPWEKAAGFLQRGRLAFSRYARTNKVSFSITVVVMVALLASWMLTKRVPTLGGGELPRLAVLPLVNLINDPDQEYFVAGMHDALLTELSKIGGLRVISRQSVLKYKESDKSIQEIARELNVHAIIEGSVMREGDQVRINVQLIEAATDEHLWADIFDRELTGVLALHSDVIKAIAREIKIKLTPQEETRLANSRLVNSQAYQAYLKGMYHLNKLTPAGFKTGLAYLQEAVDIDSGEPLAYAGLALGYSLIGHDADPDAFNKARTAAAQALKLDSSLAEVHESFAEIAMYMDWDIPRAKATFEKVIALNPSLAVARIQYSWLLLIYNQPEEAHAQAKVALELDPLNPLYAAWAGWQYFWLGQNEAGLEFARTALELNPDHPWGLYVLGAIQGAQGKFEEALETHRRAVEVRPNLKWALGYTYALAGETDKARAVAVEVAANPGPQGYWGLAMIYSVLGEPDESFRWLETATSTRVGWMPWLHVPFYFNSLHADPRFAAQLEKIGVANLPPPTL